MGRHVLRHEPVIPFDRFRVNRGIFDDLTDVPPCPFELSQSDSRRQLVHAVVPGQLFGGTAEIPYLGHGFCQLFVARYSHTAVPGGELLGLLETERSYVPDRARIGALVLSVKGMGAVLDND